MFTDAHYLHFLHSLPSLDIPAIHRLLLLCESAEKAWHADIATMKKARIKNALEIYTQKKQFNEKKEWETFEAIQKKEQLHILTKEDPEYPLLLQQATHPPHLLYYRGNTELLHRDKILAIVGSRKATSYGKKVVEQIVKEMLYLNTVIVSGLALGIDTIAHSQTLAGDGATIAVLGSSILEMEIMPPSNKRLAQEILKKGGLLLSEYPPHTPGYPSHFPQRNRIIAGISHATIVVEAAQKSGSLITARLASEISRDVFAVPGNITSTQSQGTNELIARGAIPFLSCDKLVDTLEWEQREKKKEKEKKEALALNQQEYEIASLCSTEPISLDMLIEKSDFSPQEVISLITQLTIRKIIEEHDGQYYYCPYELSRSVETTR